MQQILIETNLNKINADKAILNRSVIYCQNIYDMFNAIGIKPTLSDITNVLWWTTHNSIGEINKYVVDKIIEKAGAPNFNGVPINRQKLEELIDTPDIKSISDWIKNTPQENDGQGYVINPSLVQINNDIVSKKADTDTTITAYYTHYTKNDKGTEVATKLFEIAGLLNSWKSYIVSSQPLFEEFKGLKYESGSYRPDLSFIREQERIYPNYVVG